MKKINIAPTGRVHDQCCNDNGQHWFIITGIELILIKNKTDNEQYGHRLKERERGFGKIDMNFKPQT